MRKRRTIYFEDGRHYYLYIWEPPISLDDARMPIDQVAGTAVDTFIYGVSCRGLFYPSQVGMLFCDQDRPFREEYGVAFWRASTNLRSLIERGLDPLKVLIDRAHEKKLDFIASLRMGDLPEMNPDHLVANGGRGLGHEEIRDLLFAVLEELTGNYDIQGIELDFSAWPAIGWFFKPEEARENAAILTDWVAQIADLVRTSDPARTIGARILPHEAMNHERGLDVRDWLERGLVDFVVPMCYDPSLLDQDLPLDWIVEAAHASDVSVYGFLHPDRSDGTRKFELRDWATPEMMRAAAANYVDLGVDGLYTWFLPWPFQGEQRAWLAEMGDWPALAKGDKHYRVRRRNPATTEIGYDAPLPVQVPFGQPGQLHEIPFYVSDDLEAEAGRVQRVTLRINIADLVTADRLTLMLNGESLWGERLLRSTCTRLEPYKGQWLEFDLVRVRPRHGRNILALSLDERPADLACDIRVDDVELHIEYGYYPASGPGT